MAACAPIDVPGSRRTARRLESKPVRVLIGSEQPLFLDGLEALLAREADITVVARCAADTSILDKGLELQPDVVLLDVDIWRETSLEIVRRLNNLTPHSKVVLFTARAEGDALIEAVRLGVRGVLLKSGASSVIFECIRQVHAGAYWLPKEMAAGRRHAEHT